MAVNMATLTKDRTPYSAMAGRVQPELLRNIAAMGITHMSPVQEKVLGLPSFTGDRLVQAKTGTGKTIAFLLPALQNLLTSMDLMREYVAVLVLAPTRELAQQIADECDKLTAKRLECHIAVGGNNKKSALNKFMNGNPTVLVATPGRLIDYLGDPGPREKLSKLRCVVLDEADRMLDQGFSQDLIKILKQVPPKAKAGWQGMCFSATMPPEMNKFLHLVLDKDHIKLSTIDPNEVPTVEAIPQSVYPVEKVEDVFPTLHSLISCEKADNPDLKALIFSGTARHAGLLYHIFGSTGRAAPPNLPVFQMHSRLSQAQRTRTVEEFKAAPRGLMFASDVVGRGMDFPDIGLVIQVGGPAEKEQYVHRVGRTGRAGKTGRAVMIMTPEEMNFVHDYPDLPIENKGPFTHPKASTWPSKSIIEQALARVDDDTKVKAYVASLGFTKTLMKRYRLSPTAVVDLSNTFAYSLGLEEIPALPQSTVSKMGLKGVKGLVIEGKGLVRGAPPPTGRTGGGRSNGRFNGPDPRVPKQQRGSGPSNGDGFGGHNSPSGGGSGRGGGQRRGPRGSTGANADEPSRKRPRRAGEY